jgi:acyl carrier protein
MDVDMVVEIARRTLMDKRLVATSRLEEALGYDSLTYLQFVLELEKKSGKKLVGDLAENATLEDVSARFSQA